MRKKLRVLAEPGDIAKATKVAFRVWTIAGVVALIAVIGARIVAPDLEFGSSSLANSIRELLEFLGVLEAILIAVFTMVHVRSREALASGFWKFRETVEGLENLGNAMVQFSDRGLLPDWPLGMPYLARWASKTKGLVVRLNEITPSWKGWSSERHLERYLCLVALLPSSVARNTGDLLRKDYNWVRIRTEFDHRIRALTIALLVMNEGVTGKQLESELLEANSQLLAIIVMILVFGILAEGGHRGGTPAVANLFWAIFFVAASVINLWRILWAIDKWWKYLRMMDQAWEK